MSKQAVKTRARPMLALIPLLLLGALIAFFVWKGPAGIFPGDFPAVEQLSFGRVTLKPGSIEMKVTNGGPSDVTVAQVLVDEAYWEYSVEPSPVIGRLGSATLTIPYPWVETEPFEVAVVSSTGLTFTHAVDVAVETPKTDARFLWTFALIGLYIGLIPVVMGMTFLPFFRTLPASWLHFFLAFTAGVLVFLGVETLQEAVAGSAELPEAFGGVGAVLVAALVAFAAIFSMSKILADKTGPTARFGVALTVAVGIGLHNLGEGLAVGSAYRLGEIALSTFLVIGFAIHNTTEGIGIVSLFGNTRISLGRLAVLGAIAGLPTILGGWTGAFFFSPTIGILFLGVAAGAIFEVIVEVMRIVKEEAPGGIFSAPSLGGLAAGVLAMYVTGIFVAA